MDKRPVGPKPSAISCFSLIGLRTSNGGLLRGLPMAMVAFVAMSAVFSPRVLAGSYLFGRIDLAISGTGDMPATIAVGDLNRDGKPDLVIAHSGGSGVSVLLARSDGTYLPHVDYPTGRQPVAVVTGDFNGDGERDLAVANQNCPDWRSCGSGSVSLLLGNGDGTFQPGVDYASETRPVWLAAGDFNRDGHLDLALASSEPNSISLLLGNGDGTFQPGFVYIAYGTPYTPFCLMAADFNADGIIDLAASGAFSNSSVSVLLGNGDGTFQPHVDVTVLSGPNSLTVGDFNADAVADLAVTSSDMSAVSVLLGNGDGTFQARSDYSVGYQPAGIVAGDFNGDGTQDLVTANRSERSFSVLPGNGDGTFGKRTDYGTAGRPATLGAIDANGDGRLDLAVVLADTSRVSIVLGNGDGTFPTYRHFHTQASPWGIAGGDFNGDGKTDLVTTDLTVDGSAVTVLLGTGNGTFQDRAVLPAGPVPVWVTTGDFNRDGKLDFAVVNQTCTVLPCPVGSVSAYLGYGDGSFQPPVAYQVGSIPVFVTAADLNADGILDLIVANSGFGYTDTVSVLLGNGDGSFRLHVDYATAHSPDHVVVGDFNQDGRFDLVAGGSLLLGRGDGTFEPYLDLGVMVWAAGDFNADGRLDLVTVKGSQLALMLGNGNGTFEPAASLLDATGAISSLIARDFNGDGNLDIAAAASPSDTILIFSGKGDGTFESPVSFRGGSFINGLAAGDFNADGALDIAAASGLANSVSISLNRPVVALHPAAINFGSQGMGTASPVSTVVLSNPGPVGLSASSIAASGDFTEADTCPISPALLSPGANCTISVSFLPTATGYTGGALTITDSAPGSPHFVSLMGTGVNDAEVELSRVHLDFANQDLGISSAPQTVTLSNRGNRELLIQSVETTGEFTVSDACLPEVPAGGSCPLTVTFIPTVAGTGRGTVTIVSNAPDSPHVITLDGTGVARSAVSLSPASLEFAPQEIDTLSAPAAVALTNKGTAPLAIAGIAASRDFAVEHDCPAALPAGSACTMWVRFRPADPGETVGSLTITDDTPDSPHSVVLSGSGGDFSLGPAPGGPSSATVRAGETVEYRLLLETNSFAGSGSVRCLGAPENSTCTVLPSSLKLDGSTPVEISVTVATSASTSVLPKPARPGSPVGGPAPIAAFGIGLLSALVLITERRRGRAAWVLGTVALCAIMWSGCAGGGLPFGNGRVVSGPATAAGTYTLTVTADVSGLSRSTALTLQVNP